METKKLSLNDIIDEASANKITSKAAATNKKVEKSSGPRIVEDVSEILPMKEEENGNQAAEKHYYDLMDKAIERVKGELWEEKIKPYQDECKRLAEEAEFNGLVVEGDNGNQDSTSKAQPNLVYDFDLVPAKDPGDIVQDQIEVTDSEPDDITNIYRPKVEDPVKHNSSLKEDMLKGQEVELDMSDFDELDKTTSEDDVIDEISVEDEDVKPNEEEDEVTRLEREAEDKRLLDQIKDAVKDSVEFEKLDLSKFSIGTNKVSINATMNRIAKENNYLSQTQSVPLYVTGRTISFTPLSGSDIVKISPDSYNSRLESLRKTYAVMYAHDASVDKNKVTFTQWMKSISAGDVLQLYFGLYKATFAGSNYLAYKCDECNNFFMVKRDVRDMFKYVDGVTDEMKKRMSDIETYGEVSDNYNTMTEIYQVSENYAVLVHPRNLYNTIEVEYLDDEFKTKYASIIQPMQYIDKVYYIDKVKSKLLAVDMHPDKDSIVKTIKNKCIVIHKMLSSISVDQYSMLTGKLASLNIKENEAINMISYVIPEQKCLEFYSTGENKGKKCEHVIPESEVSPFSLLFTHHQLYLNTTLTV